MSLVS